MSDTKLSDEPGRLSALERLSLLDLPQNRGSLGHITELVRLTLRMPAAAVTLIERERQWMPVTAGLPVCETTREQSICTLTITKRTPLILEDIAAVPECATLAITLGDARLRSYIGVPLVTVEGYQVGALCAVDIVPRTFDPTKVAIIEHLARCVESELELRMAVGLDPLTQLLNRTALFNSIAAGLARFDGPMSVAIVDLDHFKAINDTFGHHVGDDVLRQVAGVLSGALGTDASLGRIGGEEFGVFLPGSTLEEACSVLRRCNRRLARMRIAAVPGLVVTASAGVAGLAEGERDAIPAFQRADLALYCAKGSGRDCVKVWEPGLDQAPAPDLALPHLQRLRPRDYETRRLLTLSA